MVFKIKDQMIMTTVRLLFILVLLQEMGFAQKSSSTLTIDTNRSTVEWTGKKVTGEHYGEIKLLSGQLTFTNKRLAAAHFEVDMNSIMCLDITDPKSNKRLVDHLKSDDFFAVAKFPKAVFELSNANMRSETEFDITGKLTIKGKTETITFPATIKAAGGSKVIEATMVIDRSKFDVKFGSQSFFENLGDKMVYDDIDIKVKLITVSNGL